LPDIGVLHQAVSAPSYNIAPARILTMTSRCNGGSPAIYPKGLPQRCEPEYASRLFSSIEIDGSFYSLQRPESYAAWYAQTPAGFTFAVKGGRLRDVEEPLANFLA
jgi:uncharacterized protein YecE (DUF72 family)